MKQPLFTRGQVAERLKQDNYELQLMRLNKNIIVAIEKTNGNIAVSFSGGKDSGMLLCEVCRVWSEIYGKTRKLVVIFANTTNEFLTMHKFIKDFIAYCERTFNVEIHLETACGGKSYKDVVFNVGFPLISKKVARQISDVRKALKQLALTWEDIKDYTEKHNMHHVEKLRKLGFNHTCVCNLTGIKQDNKQGTCILARRWLPLIGAEFETSHKCCSCLKKLPLRQVQRKLGKLQPMIGEMADNSQTRMDSYRMTGCNMFDENGVGISKPMGLVSEKTVRKYYYITKTPLAPPYGECVKLSDKDDYIFTREQNTGCKLCGFGIEYDWDRFERLYKIEPETVKNAFKSINDGGLGYTEICEYINKYCKGKIKIPKLEDNKTEKYES